MFSAYDEIAGMYHALWADWYLPAALPALETVFFSKVPAGSRVLDLCCGSGHVTKELVNRGYDVTGVDSSEALIRLAKRDLPGIDFQLQDARSLSLDRTYSAVLSTFDSLNHILNLDELGKVFAGVHHALEPGGVFVFDMNLEDAYATDLRQWSVTIDEDSTGLVRGRYDPSTKRAITELIWFVRDPAANNCWLRHRSEVEERCYDQAEILSVLTNAGFQNVEILPAKQAGMSDALGLGRIFITAKTQE